MPADEGLGPGRRRERTSSRRGEKRHGEPGGAIGAMNLPCSLLIEGELFSEEEILGDECVLRADVG